MLVCGSVKKVCGEECAVLAKVALFVQHREDVCVERVSWNAVDTEYAHWRERDGRRETYDRCVCYFDISTCAEMCTVSVVKNLRAFQMSL